MRDFEYFLKPIIQETLLQESMIYFLRFNFRVACCDNSDIISYALKKRPNLKIKSAECTMTAWLQIWEAM